MNNNQFLNRKVSSLIGILILIFFMFLSGTIIILEHLKISEELRTTAEFIPIEKKKATDRKLPEELILNQESVELLKEKGEEAEKKETELKKEETSPKKPQVLLSAGTSEKLSSEPVVAINVHFELATEDIDLTSMKADNNFVQGKSFFYADFWPSVIENEKVLYIPAPKQSGMIYICPNVISLDEVKPDCQGAINISIGETVKGMTVSLTDYEEKTYYMVLGVTGNAGGGEK